MHSGFHRRTRPPPRQTWPPSRLVRRRLQRRPGGHPAQPAGQARAAAQAGRRHALSGRHAPTGATRRAAPRAGQRPRSWARGGARQEAARRSGAPAPKAGGPGHSFGQCCGRPAAPRPPNHGVEQLIRGSRMPAARSSDHLLISPPCRLADSGQRLGPAAAPALGTCSGHCAGPGCPARPAARAFLGAGQATSDRARVGARALRGIRASGRIPCSGVAALLPNRLAPCRLALLTLRRPCQAWGHSSEAASAPALAGARLARPLCRHPINSEATHSRVGNDPAVLT